jgi:hypothetical protein
MRFISRCYCLIISLCMALSAPCLAQSADTARTQSVSQAGAPTQWMSCDENVAAPGAYAHCHLQVKQYNWLYRGDKEEVLGKRGVFRPLPVMLHVSGDSARRYAARYHRAELWHGGLVASGAALLVGSLTAAHMCITPICRHDRSGPAVRTIAYGGVGLIVVGIPFRIAAGRALGKAVDLYNASLQR